MNAQECLKGLTEIAKALWLPTGVLPYINKAYECVQAIEQSGEELPKKKNQSFYPCRICGADEGLHQAETYQCPLNGIEARVGKRQLWADTVFETDASDDAIYNNCLATITPLYAKRLLEIEELKQHIETLSMIGKENYAMLWFRQKTKIASLKKENDELKAEIKRLKGGE